MACVEVSVVLPVYNAQDTLARQLEALARSRTERQWELVVSDNGSTDDTLTIVHAWANQFPSLEVVDSAGRQSAAHARNVGVSASSGALILHCDADDRVDPDWLDRLAAALADSDLVGGSLDLLTLNDASWSGPCNRVQWTQPHHDGRFWFLPGGNLGYRRTVFDAAGGFDPCFRGAGGEDIDFGWRAQDLGFRCRPVPEAIVARAERATLAGLARQSFNYAIAGDQRRRRFPRAELGQRNDPSSRWWNAAKLLMQVHHASCRRELVRRLAYTLGLQVAVRRDHDLPPPPAGPSGHTSMAQSESGSGQPLATIGITAFNAVDTVERAVRSAVAQTWHPREVIVVDDGSTDGTVEVLQRLEADVSDLRLIQHDENQGGAAARNTVIRHAAGEVLAFFDDDDVSRPQRLQLQWQRLLEHEQRFGANSLTMVHTERLLRHPDGRTVHLGVAGSDPCSAGVSGRELIDHLLLGIPVPGEPAGAGPTSTQFGRLSSFRQLGGFDAAFRRRHDAEFNVRLASRGGRLIGVAEPLVESEVTDGPDKGPAVHSDMVQKLIIKHREQFTDPASFASARRWHLARFAALEHHRLDALRHLAAALLIQPKAVSLRLLRALRRDPRFIADLQPHQLRNGTALMGIARSYGRKSGFQVADRT